MFLVSAFIYVNEQASSEKFWNSSTSFRGCQDLVELLEILRLLRNLIVHNGSIVQSIDTENGKKIRDYMNDVRNGTKSIQWRSNTLKINPFYTIDSNDKMELLPTAISRVRLACIQALEVEGIVSLVRIQPSP